ncbi:kinase-like protein [Rickenella mellea]|uniref:Kinase-like protein n=1 Tax=Rickenella mellea TaxID=50990 RepID=A0A4Y7PJZ0_9AGAM|nr:kinase-like protein [Rickenella mellea]
MLLRARRRHVRSGFAEVKGISFPSRFTRQWLCLSEDDSLCFFKESVGRSPPDQVVKGAEASYLWKVSVLQSPLLCIPCSDIASITRYDLRPYCLLLDVGLRKVYLSFRTYLELTAWIRDISVRMAPIIDIGKPEDIVSVNRTGAELDSSVIIPTVVFKEERNVSRDTFALSLGESLEETDASGLSLFRSPSWRLFGSKTTLATTLEPSSIHCPDDDEFSLNINSDAVSTFDVEQPIAGPSRLSVQQDEETLDLTHQVERVGKYPVTSGGFADIWQGEWMEPPEYKIVAIKVIRSFHSHRKSADVIEKRLMQEINIWHRLRHQHILPLFGICHDFGPYVSMVSPWMTNGNASNYFAGKDPTETRLPRLKLLCEVAEGLVHLHRFLPSVVHGDLKAANILINDNGEALLSDFGISTLFEDISGTNCFSSSMFAGSVRWMAFELLRPDVYDTPQLTTWCDIWSFGSVCLEILSGKLPYPHRKNDIQVMHEILRGLKPRRDGTGIPPDIWQFIERCWAEPPHLRPSASDVSEATKEFHRQGVKQCTFDIG